MNLFEFVKENLNFEEVASYFGLKFINGKSLCPFHEDKKPSFHNYGTHGYCFGCRKIADPIDLEAHFKGLSLFNAVLSLAERSKIQLPEFSEQDREKFNKQTEAFKLLEKLAVYANKKIKKHPEVLEFLKKKGLNEKDIDHYLIGFVENGNPITKKLKNESEVKLAEEIGLTNKYGDRFKSRIIIPIWNYRKIVYLTGRAYPDNLINEYNPKYLHLKNSEFVYKQIAFSDSLIKEKCVVVEGITDAIAFLKAGVPVCASLGTNLGEHETESFLRAKTKLYFCFDNDDAGNTASYKLARKFQGYVVNLGSNKDCDELLAEKGIDEFKEIAENAISAAECYLDLMIEREDIIEVLREISKLEYECNKDIWLKKLSLRHGVTLGSLRKDLAYVVEERISEENEDESPSTQTEYTEEEIAKANRILESEDILVQVLDITNRAGYVREDRNKKLLYLACTSRKLPGRKKSVSIMGEGESSSGKSDLVKHILKLIPNREYKEFTYITEKALVHSRQDLSHKILCVFERWGGEKSDYTLRTAISEEKLSIFIPTKDPVTGNFESIEKEIPAEGMVYIETTIEESTEPQNANRTFEFFTDSSPELTRDVLRSQAKVYIRNEKKAGTGISYMAMRSGSFGTTASVCTICRGTSRTVSCR